MKIDTQRHKTQDTNRKIYSMVTLGDIENLSRRIAEKFDVEKIILFGSYADGTATEQSDIDRLIRLVRDWVPCLAKLLPFA
ncbi:MAG: hypothetical protein DRP62_04230 [Planctomycetota bacterium]|nr:MAG: hypothetical protein DRP62_04230 [Planctomycetota bacterium]